VSLIDLKALQHFALKIIGGFDQRGNSRAISETGLILKANENNLEALLLRGKAYYYLADYDVAMRHYKKRVVFRS